MSAAETPKFILSKLLILLYFLSSSRLMENKIKGD